MKHRKRRDKKFCTLIKNPVELITEESGVEELGSIGVIEWVPGNKECSNGLNCARKGLDCLWAVGLHNSQNDPMQ